MTRSVHRFSVFRGSAAGRDGASLGENVVREQSQPSSPLFLETGATIGPKTKDPPLISSRKITLANTGLTNEPIKGKIMGPYQSVRSTTVPWPFRHLMGEQINGAPEPLVYSPVYKFVPDAKIKPPTDQQMFSKPGQYGIDFQVPTLPNTRTYNIMGVNRNGNNHVPNIFITPAMFQTMAPQPPPFVAPVPPDPNNVPTVSMGSASEPPTEGNAAPSV